MRARLTTLVYTGALAATLAPGAAGVDYYQGLTCGLVSAKDPNGELGGDPNRYVGLVTCGPIAFVNESGGYFDSCTITVTLQVNNSVHGGGGASSSRTTTGFFVCNATLADTLTYSVMEADSLYLCTAISWTGSKGGGRVVFDADELTAGEQCALTTAFEDAFLLQPPFRR